MLADGDEAEDCTGGVLASEALAGLVHQRRSAGGAPGQGDQ